MLLWSFLQRLQNPLDDCELKCAGRIAEKFDRNDQDRLIRCAQCGCCRARTIFDPIVGAGFAASAAPASLARKLSYMIRRLLWMLAYSSLCLCARRRIPGRPAAIFSRCRSCTRSTPQTSIELACTMSSPLPDESSPPVNASPLDQPHGTRPNGVSRSLMPKVPDPEALLRRIDRAIADAELGQATRHLSLLFPSSLSTPKLCTMNDLGRPFSQALLLGPSNNAHASIRFGDRKHSMRSENPTSKLTPRPRSASRFSSQHKDSAYSQSRPRIMRERSTQELNGNALDVGNSNRKKHFLDTAPNSSGSSAVGINGK